MYQPYYNSTHQPSLHAKLETMERKVALLSNLMPKYNSTIPAERIQACRNYKDLQNQHKPAELT